MVQDLYGIEDLLEINCGCAVGVALNTNNNKNMKTELNFIEKIKLEKFATSKEAEELGETIIEAEKVITVIGQVANKLARLNGVVADTIAHLNGAVNRQDINSIKSLDSELKEILKQIQASDFATPVDGLVELFGLEVAGTKTADSKTVSKALGFKVKETK